MAWDMSGLLVELFARSWDAIKNARAPFNSEEFVKAYSEAMSDATDLAEVISQLGPEELEQTSRTILQAISIVVRAYHGKRNVKINANYMTPEPGSKQLLESASFADRRRNPDSFKCFLILRQWASNHGVLPDIILPVDGGTGKVDVTLLGAPDAYLHNRQYLIWNTRRINKHLKKIESSELRAEIKAYFDRHSSELRSFVTWPLEAPKGIAGLEPNQVIAVVNVNSDQKGVIGRFQGNQRKLYLALVPLLNLLSKLIVRMHYQSAGIAQSPSAESGS